MKFAPVEIEKSATDRVVELVTAVGWLAFFILLAVSPVIVLAIWKALL
jgi:hypothetical protein